MNLDAVDDSDTSESSLELEEKIDRKALKAKSRPEAKVVEAADEDDDEDEDEEDIPVSDLEDLDDEDREDLIPHTRLTINNTSALLAALNRIAIPTDKTAPFASHQSVVASTETASSIPDVSDDLQRELAFYSQSLEAVRLARTKLRAEGVPFSRPKDYFAEMVKEDAHMEKVKAKLVEEASSKKAAAEARKLRDLKKFGKQVQVAKLQERHKEKRETLDKIKTLKRSKFILACPTRLSNLFLLLTKIIQSAKNLAVMAAPMKLTCSTWASTTSLPNTPREVGDLGDLGPAGARWTPENRMASGKRRTRSTDSAGRSATPSQVMLSARAT